MPADRRFPVTRVTPETHELLRAHEVALMALGAASTAPDIDAAFSVVTLTRETLYQHVARMESELHRDTTIFLRF